MVQTKKLIAILLPLALGMSQHAFAEDPVAPSPITVSGGTVKFTGSIVNAPCAVDNSADGQSVELGQYRVADFSKTGDVSAARTFNIGLSNCALDTYSRASVTFSGNTPPCQDSCRLELKNFRGPETTKMNTYSPERKAALIARM
ncbi:fimbrial protein, partial [Serratia ficaria]|uniref:fimbrial protein n=1 Tax=Serratia ficaria TaxID=61651 RepID=UPI0037036DAB